MKRNAGLDFRFPRQFVSEVDLEQITGVSRRTWQKHRLFKRGPQYYRIHGAIRYDLQEVLTWIKGSSVQTGGHRDR